MWKHMFWNFPFLKMWKHMFWNFAFFLGVSICWEKATYFDICRQSPTYGHILTYVDSSFDSTHIGYGVSNFYKKKIHKFLKLYQKKNFHYTDSHVSYNKPIRIKSNHCLSQTSGTVGVHSDISMSLSYKSDQVAQTPTVSPRFHSKAQTLGHASWRVLHLHLLSILLRPRPSPL